MFVCVILCLLSFLLVIVFACNCLLVIGFAGYRLSLLPTLSLLVILIKWRTYHLDCKSISLISFSQRERQRESVKTALFNRTLAFLRKVNTVQRLLSKMSPLYDSTNAKPTVVYLIDLFIQQAYLELRV